MLDEQWGAFFFFFDNLKQIPSYLSCSGPWFSTSNFFEAFTHIHYLEKSGWCSDAPRDSQHPWKKQTKSQHWNISVSNQDFRACTLDSHSQTIIQIYFKTNHEGFHFWVNLSFKSGNMSFTLLLVLLKGLHVRNLVENIYKKHQQKVN